MKTNKISVILSVLLAAALALSMVCSIGMFVGVKSMMRENRNAVREAEEAANTPEESSKAAGKTENAEGAEEGTVQKDGTVEKEKILSYFGKDGEGALAMFRDVFSEYIVFYDEDYRFVKINDSLKKNRLKEEGFDRDKKGFFTYREDGKSISHKGIDVSRYQGEIDWQAVKEDGVEYAIIRVGYRGYGSGEIVDDENAKANLEGANKAGVKTGVYFFSQAVSEKEAKEEAQYVLEVIKKYRMDYPVVFDTEEIVGDTSRTENLTAKERTDIAIAFCETIKDAGYTPMIYANLKWFATALEMERLEAYGKWFAYYDDTLYFPYQIDMWQYSGTGKVKGIDGDVDINISFREY